MNTKGLFPYIVYVEKLCLIFKHRYGIVIFHLFRVVFEFRHFLDILVADCLSNVDRRNLVDIIYFQIVLI